MRFATEFTPFSSLLATTTFGEFPAVALRGVDAPIRLQPACARSANICGLLL